MTPRWQILIASVYVRHDLLVGLLDSLAPQLEPYDGRVEVLIDRDDCLTPVGVKRNALMLAADGDFVSFVDDDDEVSRDYVKQVMWALAEDVDMVGFQVDVSVDGVMQKHAIHHLDCGGWYETGDAYWRDLSHICPTRRTAALAGLPFNPGFGEDAAWVEKVRASGLVKTGAYVNAPLYHYAYSTTSSLFRGGPRHVGVEPPLLDYPYVRVLRHDESVASAP